MLSGIQRGALRSSENMTVAWIQKSPEDVYQKVTTPSIQLECRPVDDRDGASWNEFVDSQPDSQLGHRYEWRRVFEKAYGKRCVYLAARRDGEWLGVLPLVHLKGPLASNRWISLPYLDHAGILARDAEAAGRLVQTAIDLAGKTGAEGIEVRRLSPEGIGSIERSTLLLELPESSEALWKSFKPKVRNQVRKAEKHGLRTERGEPRHWESFYGVFCKNMRDLGSPVHGRRFLSEVRDSFGERARLYVTLDERERVVGGAIALVSGSSVTVPWASSLREVFSWCPNHSLYWKILSESTDEGARCFDFGRSWYRSGTYRFKTQWGAQPRPLDWAAFDTEGHPRAVGGLRPTEHGRIVGIWSRLPLCLTNFVGPLIRRQISN